MRPATKSILNLSQKHVFQRTKTETKTVKAKNKAKHGFKQDKKDLLTLKANIGLVKCKRQHNVLKSKRQVFMLLSLVVTKLSWFFLKCCPRFFRKDNLRKGQSTSIN